MDHRDKILEFIKQKGPVLPVAIAKEIDTNILMASAHLAELTANHKLRISTVKVGGSPLYFLAGQEELLQKFIGGFNDKEKKAFDLLNEKKILKDSDLEPVIRVALRSLKDFAVPLTVSFNDTKEIFWKWYLVADDESEKLIKKYLNIEDTPKVEEKNGLDSIIKPDATSKEYEYIPKPQNAEESEKKARKARKKPKDETFFKNLMKFFEDNRINIVHSEIIKKNSEMDFILEVPSVVGNLQYYCKAKNKKRLNDSDLSTAFVKGQFKKLPVLFLSPGELSAKAEQMMRTELNGITFKRL